jgi:hypothetical protein
MDERGVEERRGGGRSPSSPSLRPHPLSNPLKTHRNWGSGVVAAAADRGSTAAAARPPRVSRARRATVRSGEEAADGWPIGMSEKSGSPPVDGPGGAAHTSGARGRCAPVRPRWGRRGAAAGGRKAGAGASCDASAAAAAGGRAGRDAISWLVEQADARTRFSGPRGRWSVVVAPRRSGDQGAGTGVRTGLRTRGEKLCVCVKRERGGASAATTVRSLLSLALTPVSKGARAAVAHRTTPRLWPRTRFLTGVC